MAAPTPQMVPVGPETLIVIKVVVGNTNRRFKVPLKDLGAHILPHKLRALLVVPSTAHVTFERYSDSAGTYITLDSDNAVTYKQLYRAAKAKLKLRIRATINMPQPSAPVVPSIMDEQQPAGEMLSLPTPPKASPASRPSYLATVLTTPAEQSEQPSALGVSSPPIPVAVKSEDSPNPLITLPEKKPPVKMPSKLSHADVAKKISVLKIGDHGMAAEASGPAQAYIAPFSIDCNHCGEAVSDAHHHCSICDNGDFDLCPACVAADVTCGGEGHWLIKRRIQAGQLVNSVTETIASKTKQADQPSATEEKKDGATVPYASRTCNSCIYEIPDEDALTCTNCADYDLCTTCFSLDDHGHHPGHRFHPVTGQTCDVSSRILSLCEPGRGVAHAAICDGCDQHIAGVRHKCLTCPDWDYCSGCILTAAQDHPGHRFAQLFEQLPDINPCEEVHIGIYCDGPLCASKPHKQYIRGIRYKCSVCHDTDFCASCEAVPVAAHNRTHPLIKFKTPVRHVSVTTLGESNDGQNLPQMGDRPNARNAATETMAAASPRASVVDVPPACQQEKEARKEPVIQQADIASQLQPAPDHLRAIFLGNLIADKTEMRPDHKFTQAWTLQNPGPRDWPSGCALHFSGGLMLNVDTENPSSVTALVAATKSTARDAVVRPGQIATFSVVLKSPSFEGRAISYWRLKTPEGVAFGKQLSVDINVKSTASIAIGAPVETEDPTNEATVTSEKLAEEAAAEKQSFSSESVDPEVKTDAASGMIFPKLDKESPASSLHEASAPAAEDSKPSGAQTEEELCAEVESLSFEGESDDGFLTDEEYDILDASDEDLQSEVKGTVKK